MSELWLVYHVNDKPIEDAIHVHSWLTRRSVYHERQCEDNHKEVRILNCAALNWQEQMRLAETFQDTNRVDTFGQWKDKENTTFYVAACGPRDNEFLGGVYGMRLLAEERIAKAHGGRVYVGKCPRRTLVNMFWNCPFDNKEWL